MVPTSDSSTRRGRRRGRRETAVAPASLEQLPWAQPQYTDPPTEPLDQEGLERVHDAALRICEEFGSDFLHEGAREIL